MMNPFDGVEVSTLIDETSDSTSEERLSDTSERFWMELNGRSALQEESEEMAYEEEFIDLDKATLLLSAEGVMKVLPMYSDVAAYTATTVARDRLPDPLRGHCPWLITKPFPVRMYIPEIEEEFAFMDRLRNLLALIGRDMAPPRKPSMRSKLVSRTTWTVPTKELVQMAHIAGCRTFVVNVYAMKHRLAHCRELWDEIIFRHGLEDPIMPNQFDLGRTWPMTRYVLFGLTTALRSVTSNARVHQVHLTNFGGLSFQSEGLYVKIYHENTHALKGRFPRAGKIPKTVKSLKEWVSCWMEYVDHLRSMTIRRKRRFLYGLRVEISGSSRYIATFVEVCKSADLLTVAGLENWLGVEFSQFDYTDDLFDDLLAFEEVCSERFFGCLSSLNNNTKLRYEHLTAVRMMANMVGWCGDPSYNFSSDIVQQFWGPNATFLTPISNTRQGETTSSILAKCFGGLVDFRGIPVLNCRLLSNPTLQSLKNEEIAYMMGTLKFQKAPGRKVANRVRWTVKKSSENDTYLGSFESKEQAAQEIFRVFGVCWRYQCSPRRGVRFTNPRLVWVPI